MIRQPQALRDLAEGFKPGVPTPVFIEAAFYDAVFALGSSFGFFNALRWVKTGQQLTRESLMDIFKNNRPEKQDILAWAKKEILDKPLGQASAFPHSLIMFLFRPAIGHPHASALAAAS